eukprot:354767-Chlamydomonas_euryale.AAC.4
MSADGIASTTAHGGSKQSQLDKTDAAGDGVIYYPSGRFAVVVCKHGGGRVIAITADTASGQVGNARKKQQFRGYTAIHASMSTRMQACMLHACMCTYLVNGLHDCLQPYRHVYGQPCIHGELECLHAPAMRAAMQQPCVQPCSSHACIRPCMHAAMLPRPRCCGMQLT